MESAHVVASVSLSYHIQHQHRVTIQADNKAAAGFTVEGAGAASTNAQHNQLKTHQEMLAGPSKAAEWGKVAGQRCSGS